MASGSPGSRAGVRFALAISAGDRLWQVFRFPVNLSGSDQCLGGGEDRTVDRLFNLLSGKRKHHGKHQQDGKHQQRALHHVPERAAPVSASKRIKNLLKSKPSIERLQCWARGLSPLFLPPWLNADSAPSHHDRIREPASAFTAPKAQILERTIAPADSDDGP
jgi:hypothetical protein